MMQSIFWDFDPTFINWPLEVRWYGVLFAAGFAAGYFLMSKVVKRENIDSRVLDRLLLFIMVGTVVGARLGHVFFYDWDSYKDNLWEIFAIRNGGLASHGGMIGVALAIYLFQRKSKQRSWLWWIDHVAVFVALTGMFIRMGNLANHEIVGVPTNAPMAMVYSQPFEEQVESKAGIQDIILTPVEGTRRDSANNIDVDKYEMQIVLHEQLDESTRSMIAEGTVPAIIRNMNSDINTIYTHYDSPTFRRFPDDKPPVMVNNNTYKMTVWGIPRHPAQLFEAIAYLLIFFILYWMMKAKHAGDRRGLLLGSFLILIFGARFLIEFLKVKQTAITAEWTLNMGQILSIPAILVGIFLVVRAMKRPAEPTEGSPNYVAPAKDDERKGS